MTQAFREERTGCRQAIVAWGDGNPYYIDEAGAKKSAYHPLGAVYRK